MNETKEEMQNGCAVIMKKIHITETFVTLEWIFSFFKNMKTFTHNFIKGLINEAYCTIFVYIT